MVTGENRNTLTYKYKKQIPVILQCSFTSQFRAEELHFVENGCHDNPMLDVANDSQPQMQEKKPNTNGLSEGGNGGGKDSNRWQVIESWGKRKNRWMNEKIYFVLTVMVVVWKSLKGLVVKKPCCLVSFGKTNLILPGNSMKPLILFFPGVSQSSSN